MSLSSFVAAKPQRGARATRNPSRAPRGICCHAETKTVEWSVLDDALAYVKSSPVTEVCVGAAPLRFSGTWGPVRS